jgi:hypothetical protein
MATVGVTRVDHFMKAHAEDADSGLLSQYHTNGEQGAESNYLLYYATKMGIKQKQNNVAISELNSLLGPYTRSWGAGGVDRSRKRARRSSKISVD